jgi:voltage-gated potassium channel
MSALGMSMGRRGFGYVVALTLAIILVGAAGMYAFESNTPDGSGLNDYGTALWWTAMLMTTMGSEYWPQTPEGRILCFILALYSSAVFGYVTAVLATFFIGRDAEDNEAEIAGAKSLDVLHTELKALRQEIQALSRQNSEVNDS